MTLLPQRLKPVLAAHLEKVKALHAEDLVLGLGEAPLPQALAGKYPWAGHSWAWQFAIPSSQCCCAPYTGRTVRFHLHEKNLQRAVKEATRRAAIAKPVGCHTFRRAFATPHGYCDDRIIRRDLAEGGFRASPQTDTVASRSRAHCSSVPAIAYCQGAPLRNEIEARDPLRAGAATNLAAEAIAKRFGRGPVDGKIQAHVITIER